MAMTCICISKVSVSPDIFYAQITLIVQDTIFSLFDLLDIFLALYNIVLIVKPI
jgi:hypothetical protein